MSGPVRYGEFEAPRSFLPRTSGLDPESGNEVRCLRGGLSQLLGDPTIGRIFRGVEVENASPGVANHKEAIKHAESRCRHREEVHRRDHFPMVSQEDQPELVCVSLTAHSSKLSRDGALGYLQA